VSGAAIAGSASIAAPASMAAVAAVWVVDRSGRAWAGEAAGGAIAAFAPTMSAVSPASDAAGSSDGEVELEGVAA
jgi:hypothetical protein